DLGELLPDLLQTWDPLPLPGVELADLLPRLVRDRAGPVGGAVDGDVVHHDHLTIPTQVHVELQLIGAVGDGAAERAQRVLRLDRHRTAMAGDDERVGRWAAGHGDSLSVCGCGRVMLWSGHAVGGSCGAPVVVRLSGRRGPAARTSSSARAATAPSPPR